MSLAPAWPPDLELINTIRGASGSSGARNFFVLARYGVGILQVRRACPPLSVCHQMSRLVPIRQGPAADGHAQGEAEALLVGRPSHL